MAAASCSLEGNSDLYGLGIRLGVYLQLITTLLSNHFLPKELSGAWDANFVFLAALLIAGVKGAAQAHGLCAAEAFVILQMMLAFLLSVFTSYGNLFLAAIDCIASGIDGNWLPDSKNVVKVFSELGQAHGAFSSMGGYSRAVIVFAIATFNVWFWFPGVLSLGAVGSGCSTRVFLFTSVDANGPAQIVFRLLSALMLMYRVFCFLLLLSPWLLRLVNKIKTTKSEVIKSHEPEKTLMQHIYDFITPEPLVKTTTTKEGKTYHFGAQGRKYDRRRSKYSKQILFYGHVISLAGSCVTILYSVVAIELTLVWNNILDIYELESAGQFIPFFIGLGGLVKTSIAILVENWAKFNTTATRPEISPERDTGLYRYRLNPFQIATFSAKSPRRRWSLDAKHSQMDVPNKITYAERMNIVDKLAPDLVAYDTDRSHCSNRPPGTRRIRPLWHSGRFIYASPDGKQHVFHDQFLTSSYSFSEGIDPKIPLPPHTIHGQLFNSRFSLKGPESTQLQSGRSRGLHRPRLLKKFLNDRNRWAARHDDVLILRNPVQNLSTSDIDIVTYEERSASSTSHLSPEFSMDRRWSFGDVDEAHDQFGRGRLPFQREKGLGYEASLGSMEYASNGSQSTSRSSEKDRKKTPTRRRIARTVLKCLAGFIIICLHCTPLTALAMYLRSKFRLWRSRLAMRWQAHHREEELASDVPIRYNCPNCDNNFQSSTETQSWVSGSYLRTSTSSIAGPSDLRELRQWAFNPPRAVYEHWGIYKWWRGLRAHLILTYGIALEERKRKEEALKKAQKERNSVDAADQV